MLENKKDCNEYVCNVPEVTTRSIIWICVLITYDDVSLSDWLTHVQMKIVNNINDKFVNYILINLYKILAKIYWNYDSGSREKSEFGE